MDYKKLPSQPKLGELAPNNFTQRTIHLSAFVVFCLKNFPSLAGKFLLSRVHKLRTQDIVYSDAEWRRYAEDGGYFKKKLSTFEKMLYLIVVRSFWTSGCIF